MDVSQLEFAPNLIDIDLEYYNSRQNSIFITRSFCECCDLAFLTHTSDFFMVNLMIIKKPRLSAMACTVAAATLCLGISELQAASVTGFVVLTDVGGSSPSFGDIPGMMGTSSATTNSPIINDADGDSIAGSFAPVTLNTGQTITLSGSVIINRVANPGGNLSNQFRIGLFNATTPLTAGSGVGLVGIAASDEDIDITDGTQANPFSTTGNIVSFNADIDNNIPVNTNVSFSLAVTRVNTTDLSLTATFLDTDNSNAVLAQINPVVGTSQIIAGSPNLGFLKNSSSCLKSSLL